MLTLKNELKINYKNLEELSKACSMQAATYQYYLEQFILISKREKDLKELIVYKEEELKRIKGLKAVIIKESKKCSDKVAEGGALNTVEVQDKQRKIYELKLELNEREKETGLIKSYVKALEQKQGMLREICQNRRTELFSDVSVKEEERAESFRKRFN